MSIESLAHIYRDFCIAFALRYLDREGTDRDVLVAFQAHFAKMMKLSTIALDEIDAYLMCRYVDRTAEVLQIYDEARKQNIAAKRRKIRRRNEW